MNFPSYSDMHNNSGSDSICFLLITSRDTLSAEIILSHHKICFHSKTMPDIFLGNISSTHFYCPSLYKSHGFHREQNMLLASIFQDISQHILSSKNVNMTRSCNVDSEYISLSPACFSKEIPAPERSRSENPCFMDLEIVLMF